MSQKKIVVQYHVVQFKYCTKLLYGFQRKEGKECLLFVNKQHFTL